MMVSPEHPRAGPAERALARPVAPGEVQSKRPGSFEAAGSLLPCSVFVLAVWCAMFESRPVMDRLLCFAVGVAGLSNIVLWFSLFLITSLIDL